MPGCRNMLVASCPDVQPNRLKFSKPGRFRRRAVQGRLNPSRIGSLVFRDFPSIPDSCMGNKSGNEGVGNRGNEGRFLARSFPWDSQTAFVRKVPSEGSLERSTTENSGLVSSFPESRPCKRETKGNKNGNGGKMRGFRVGRFLVVWKRKWITILNS